MQGATLGIDFGTSNSAAGVCIDGRPVLIPLEAAAQTMPTAVFFGVGATQMVTGTAAQEALVAGTEGRYMRALKSVLGTSLMGEARMFLGRRMDFYDIIAGFLRQLKTQAEAHCGTRFAHALSGRPVRFHSSDPARNAKAEADLTECYHRAGFESVRYIYEPEAAALASGVAEGADLSLIVDIGGGTSDFCLFRMGDGIDVRASLGVRLGGTNFDRRLSIDHVMPLLGQGGLIRDEMGQGRLPAPKALFQKLATWEQIPFLYTAEVKRDVDRMRRRADEPDRFARLYEVLDMELGHEVAFAVEAGKIAANAQDACIDLHVVEPQLQTPLTQVAMATSLSAEVAQIAQAASEAVAQAGVTAKDVARVIFVGGSSLLHPVQQAMAAAFPQAHLDHRDAFTAVVDGLALASADPMRFGYAPA